MSGEDHTVADKRLTKRTRNKGAEGIEIRYLAEAVQYRSLDRKLWG